jgi:hypothetical protein
MGLGGGDGFMKGGGSGPQGMFGNLFGEKEGMFDGAGSSMQPYQAPGMFGQASTQSIRQGLGPVPVPQAGLFGP